MGQEGTRLFPKEIHTRKLNWNIVELEVLESRRLLRQKVFELTQLANNFSITTDEIQQQLYLNFSEFGSQLASQLLRSLNCDDPMVRHSILRLLILLNDVQMIEPLRHMSLDKRLSRQVRLSASLALAGMEAAGETQEIDRNTRLYAIS